MADDQKIAELKVELGELDRCCKRAEESGKLFAADVYQRKWIETLGKINALTATDKEPTHD